MSSCVVGMGRRYDEKYNANRVARNQMRCNVIKSISHISQFTLFIFDLLIISFDKSISRYIKCERCEM